MTVPRRASARLVNIPLEKRPFYGPDRRKPSNVDPSCQNGGCDDIRTCPENGGNELQNVRASLRLKNILRGKRPYYGTCCKKRSSGKFSAKQLKVPFEAGEAGENGKFGVDYGLAKHHEPHRASPRLKEMSEEKGSYYGTSCNTALPEKSCTRKIIFDMDGELLPNVAINGNCSNDQNEDGVISRNRGKKVVNAEKKNYVRASPRLKNIPKEKRPYYGTSPKKSALDESKMKKIKIDCLEHEVSPNAVGKIVGNENSSNDLNGDTILLESRGHRILGADIDEYDNLPAASHDSKAKIIVKRVLRLFNKYHLQLVQEEAKRCEEKEDNGVKKSKRPDLKAISKILKNKESLYPKGRFGNVPGIEVGDRFNSRAEMVAVGLHRRLVNGIDYEMGKSHVKLQKEYEGCKLPLTTAIVLSGQYQDDHDWSEDIIYTGEGGNNLLGNKCQVKDQVLCRGNLALKNNMEQKVPVRVIRGHKPTGADPFYVYAGLYEVAKFWKEKGKAGFNVFKYKLNRLKGQKMLPNHNLVHFVRGKTSGVLQESGVVCQDISNGLENKCIRVINMCNPPTAPTGFKYIRSNMVANNVVAPPNAPGCKCKGKCTNSRSCSCARLNGGDFPYVHHNGGRLIEPMAVVFECGPNCGCGPDCVNRTSQQGLKYSLEVYRTETKGWAVRSRDSIPSGAPVCEYVGELRKSDELENVLENDYIFEIDCWKTINGIGGREKRLGKVSVPTCNIGQGGGKEDLDEETDSEFCIDAGPFGNVARFINHSCEPNLFVQCVLSSHHDIRLARVVLFAADPIPPMQELTYDYGYALGSVIGPDGETKQLPCHCGTADCRKRLY